jgi:hypothetical protein
MNCGVCLEPSSALKVIVWGNLDWGMQTVRRDFIALHMISVCYPTRVVQGSIVKKDIYVFNYDIIVESVH